jgi:hypothetical protein
MDSKHWFKGYLPDTEPMDDTLLRLLREKKLQHRDLAVLRALLMNMRGAGGRDQGRIYASLAHIAELVGSSPNNVSLSVSRMRKERLLVRCWNKRTSERFYLLDPHLFSMGRSQKEGHLWSQFKAAFENEGEVND